MRSLLVLTAIVAVASLVGCSGSSESASTPATTTAPAGGDGAKMGARNHPVLPPGVSGDGTERIGSKAGGH